MNSFQLHFQSKVNVQTNKIIGYEVLLRNTKEIPSYPALDMDEIINNKEKHAIFLNWFESELISYFNLFPTVIFSVNFSPIQLLYPETIVFFTNMTGFRKQMVVEITEDIIRCFYPTRCHNIKEAEKEVQYTLSLIKDKGYKISLDDVGSGRNSLEKVESYLSYIDQIKYSLIKSITRDIQDETTQLFLKAWNSFAKKNKVELVVEGIEDKQTMDFLKGQGIYLQQGYYLGKPSKMILV